MNKYYFFLVLASFLLLQNCSGDVTAKSGFEELEKSVSTDPSPDNVNKLLGAYNSYIQKNKDDIALLRPVFEKAFHLAEKERPKASSVYLAGLIRNSELNNPEVGNWLYQLANNLDSQGKSEAKSIVFSNLLDRFPSHEKSEEISSSLSGKSSAEIINQLASARLENPDQFGINKAASIKYVDACEAYALSKPNDPKSPELLFDAAEMAKLLKTNNKALGIYDWLIVHYPNYKKTPSALFIKAFVLENELNNIELARESYELFLEKYPNDDFADDARFSLENLGKSPEEVLKAIEANAKK